ncbi:MAG: hypothetical protein WC702_04945 [Patescibacteria group bacterium]|jgi:hypothetical protein
MVTTKNKTAIGTGTKVLLAVGVLMLGTWAAFSYFPTHTGRGSDPIPTPAVLTCMQDATGISIVHLDKQSERLTNGCVGTVRSIYNCTSATRYSVFQTDCNAETFNQKLPDLAFNPSRPNVFVYFSATYLEANVYPINIGNAVAPAGVKVKAYWLNAKKEILPFPNAGEMFGTGRRTEWVLPAKGPGNDYQTLAFDIIPNKNARYLRVVIDPDHTLLESDKKNNTTEIAIPTDLILNIDPTVAKTCASATLPAQSRAWHSLYNAWCVLPVGSTSTSVCLDKYTLTYTGCGACPADMTNAERFMTCPAQ